MAQEIAPTVDIEHKIDDLLLESRRIFIGDGVDNDSAKAIMRRLWYLELKDPGKPILLVINSPGGSVDAGFAIWDQVKMITSPVTTLVTGLAASMGSILSLVAEPGGRLATPNARIMIHQPSIHGGVQGVATDLAIRTKEILKLRDKIVNVYCEATGKDTETIKKAIDRDTWMSAEEAKEYGLLDGVVASFAEVEKLMG